jgi:streptogramin lyase
MSKAWKVWSLPKSKGGCYAVYVDTNDKVEVTDFVAHPTTRFDPGTRRYLCVRVHSSYDIIYLLFLAEAHLTGAHAFHIEL